MYTYHCTFVDFAFAEPLHNSNNAWQYIHSLLLEEAVSRSNLPALCGLSTLPQETLLKKFILSVKNDVRASQLYKKLKKWLKEGRKKKFEYCFTGKETNKFMFLVHSLSRDNDTAPEKLRLLSIAFAAMQLPEAVSKFSQVQTDETICKELEVKCQLFFNTCSQLLKTVNPTVWTVGYAIPFHNKMLFKDFGLGLGINTMQGHEAKHNFGFICTTCYTLSSLEFSNAARVHKLHLAQEKDPFHF